MSIFFPYDISSTVTYISTLFNIDLSGLTAFESTLLTIFCDLYFFITWFVIIYFALKIFNRLWERVF